MFFPPISFDLKKICLSLYSPHSLGVIDPFLGASPLSSQITSKTNVPPVNIYSYLIIATSSPINTTQLFFCIANSWIHKLNNAINWIQMNNFSIYAPAICVNDINARIVISTSLLFVHRVSRSSKFIVKWVRILYFQISPTATVLRRNSMQFFPGDSNSCVSACLNVRSTICNKWSTPSFAYWYKEAFLNCV